MERKLPYLTILGASMEGRILSVADLKTVASLPSIDLMRATLCQTLGGHAQQLSSHLTHHQVSDETVLPLKIQSRLLKP